MKKILAALSIGAIFTSCSVTLPAGVTSNPIGSKFGSAKTAAILGLFFDGGDASQITAAKNGGIKKISVVDFKQSHYLGGLYSTYETIVNGE